MVLSLLVVVLDPDIESRLSLLDRLEAVLGEEPLAHGLVQALDLVRGGRRIGDGEEGTHALFKQMRSKSTLADLWASLPMKTLPLPCKRAGGTVQTISRSQGVAYQDESDTDFYTSHVGFRWISRVLQRVFASSRR
jgi:hypothetical protein